MSELDCPVCSVALEEAGRTYKCEKCEGAWITEEALVAILEQRTSTLVELPWQAREDAARPCPACKQPMKTQNLGSVALDRCLTHGVWFDANELTTLLRQAKRFKTHPGEKLPHDEREGLLKRIAKLFGGG